MSYPTNSEADGLHFTHYLKDFSDSFVLLSSRRDADTAIVFVHGWNGDPFTTWSDFHLLADNCEIVSDFYAGSDLFFFGYESHEERINASSHRLLKFVDDLILRPKIKHYQLDISQVVPWGMAVKTTNLLPQARNYSRVVFVAHSEGGVVVRQSIIRRYDQLSSRRSKSLIFGQRLSLFAPAIGGFRPAGLLGTLVNTPVIGPILSAFLNSGSGFQDLGDKDYLRELREKTEKAAKSSQLPALFADILWGYRDKIVHPTKYDHDAEDFVDRNHIDICKPKLDYILPLEFVARN